MSYLLPYHSRSNTDALMEMVARGCERFLRIGALVENSSEVRWAPLSNEKRAEIIARVKKEGPENMTQIARDLGVSYSTVVRVTRHVRGVEGR